MAEDLTQQIPPEKAIRNLLESSQAEQTEDLNRELKKLEYEDKKTDIKLKKKFAYSFIIILAVQLIIMNIVFVYIGCGYMKFSDLTIQLYMGGTLTEVFGIVYIICRYLFPKR